MKTVATIIDTNLSALIGPTKNIERIYANADLFSSLGISLVGPYYPGTIMMKGDRSEARRYSGLKDRVKMLMKQSAISSWVLYQLTHYKNACEALDKYFAETDDGVDLVVFRESVSAAEYNRRGGKKPYVLVLHCDGTNDMFYSGSAFPKLKSTKYQIRLDADFENVCRNASGLLFLSDKAIAKFNKRYPGIECPKGYYHQGLDRPASRTALQIEKDKEHIVFISVGTVCKRKNQTAIVRAFSRIDSPVARLIIVGGGDDLDNCKTLAHSLGIEDRCLFAGPTNSVGDYLAVSDVFVSASLDEGVPNAAVEAMSYGLPLILTDVGFCCDLIADNGLLIRTDEDLAEAMKSMLALDLETMGANSLNLYSQYYTVDNMCREHADFYKLVTDYADRN